MGKSAQPAGKAIVCNVSWSHVCIRAAEAFRLVELRNLSDTLLATYAYDGHSLRIAKVVSGWRTWYIYAGTQLISEYEDSASATYSSPTSPGGVSQYTTELYQHGDHLTTRFTTDNSGQKANDQGHYPFGEVWYTSGQADPSVRRKFTSYMQDDEAATGKINYAYYRQHSARLSRFLRPDPIFGNLGNPQRLNRYAYVAGDPIGKIDPDGRDMVVARHAPPSGSAGGINPISGAGIFGSSGCTEVSRTRVAELESTTSYRGFCNWERIPEMSFFPVTPGGECLCTWECKSQNRLTVVGRVVVYYVVEICGALIRTRLEYVHVADQTFTDELDWEDVIDSYPLELRFVTTVGQIRGRTDGLAECVCSPPQRFWR